MPLILPSLSASKWKIVVRNFFRLRAQSPRVWLSGGLWLCWLIHCVFRCCRERSCSCRSTFVSGGSTSPQQKEKAGNRDKAQQRRRHRRLRGWKGQHLLCKGAAEGKASPFRPHEPTDAMPFRSVSFLKLSRLSLRTATSTCDKMSAPDGPIDPVLGSEGVSPPSLHLSMSGVTCAQQLV